MDVPKILDDPREILSMSYNFEEGGYFEVGRNCTKIRVYGEQGEHCLVPWLAVYSGEEIMLRIPAGVVTVECKKEKP